MITEEIHGTLRRLAGRTSKYSILRIIPETIEVLDCLRRRHSKQRDSNITMLRTYTYNLFTTFPQKLWKSWILQLVLVTFCLTVFIACSSSRAVQKQNLHAADNQLITSGEDEVKKKFGEPTSVSRTGEDHILWTYSPSWKIMPNDKGTVYVEFENGKVIRVFRTK